MVWKQDVNCLRWKYILTFSTIWTWRRLSFFSFLLPSYIWINSRQLSTSIHLKKYLHESSVFTHDICTLLLLLSLYQTLAVSVSLTCIQRIWMTDDGRSVSSISARWIDYIAHSFHWYLSMRIHKLDAIGPLTAPGSLGLTTPDPPSQALLMGLFFRPNPIGQSNHRVLYYLTAFQKIRSPVIIMVQRRLIFDPESFTSCRNFFSLFFFWNPPFFFISGSGSFSPSFQRCCCSCMLSS